MTKTITIPNPKNFQRKKDLVLISRDEYESLMRFKTGKIGEITLTVKQKKAFSQSDKELRSGAHFTLDGLEQYLARSYSKTRS